jgi:hypothetical protein
MNYIINNLTQQHYIIIIFILLLLTFFMIICTFIFLIIFLVLLAMGYILFNFQQYCKTGNFIQKNDYDEITKQYLLKYGDYKIQKTYLITNYLSYYSVTLLNYVSFFKYSKLTQSLGLFHTKLLLIVSKENETKLLIVHKSPNIILTDNFHIKPTCYLQKIPIRSNKYSIQDMLSSLKKKMGNKYFNWNVADNNCQDFSKEIIHILKKKNDKKKYIEDNIIQKILNEYNYTIYDVYIMNVLSSIVIMYCNNYIAELLVIN